MNPLYTVLESRHRWSILAGLSFGAGCLIAMMMLAYGWAHWLARLSLLAGIVVALYCLARGFLVWKHAAERELARLEAEARKRAESRTEDAAMSAGVGAEPAAAPDRAETETAETG